MSLEGKWISFSPDWREKPFLSRFFNETKKFWKEGGNVVSKNAQAIRFELLVLKFFIAVEFGC